MVPSVSRCLLLMEQYRMPEHIRAHSLMVSRVAQLLVRSLNEGGLGLSRDIVLAAALLHDIGKTQSLETGQDHSELGRQICIRHGFQEISEAVGDHVLLKEYAGNGRVNEKEIVYYADKRVNHDRIVGLDERLAYILNQYGRNREWIRSRIHRNFDICREVEQRLFSRLGFPPGSVAELAAKERIG